MKYEFKAFGSILGSRMSGARIREELKEKIRATSDKFIFDLAEVRVVSHSFADECFGKLSVEIKEDYHKKTSIENANDFVKGIIDSAVERRASIGL